MVDDVEPAAFVVLATGALGAIGLLRRGATPVSQAGRAVTRAGFGAVFPILQGVRHLPWPLRPVTSTVVTYSTAAVISQVALVVDGASTLVEAASRLETAGWPHTESDTSARIDQATAVQRKRPATPVPTGASRKATPGAPKSSASGGGRASTARARATTTRKTSTPATKRESARKSAAKKSTASPSTSSSGTGSAARS
jgi:hypothetical protein